MPNGNNLTIRHTPGTVPVVQDPDVTDRWANKLSVAEKLDIIKNAVVKTAAERQSEFENDLGM